MKIRIKARIKASRPVNRQEFIEAATTGTSAWPSTLYLSLGSWVWNFGLTGSVGYDRPVGPRSVRQSSVVFYAREFRRTAEYRGIHCETELSPFFEQVDAAAELIGCSA